MRRTFGQDKLLKWILFHGIYMHKIINNKNYQLEEDFFFSFIYFLNFLSKKKKKKKKHRAILFLSFAERASLRCNYVVDAYETSKLPHVN